MSFFSGKRVKVGNLIDQHMRILEGLQYSSGLFAASKKDGTTGYDKSWLRDNFYECLAFQAVGEWETVVATMSAILAVFAKHEGKLDAAIANKPQHPHEYIHARVNPETFEEFWEDWGNKQNDAVGALLFMFGELERQGKSVVRDENARRIVQKLVRYLASIEFWQDDDSGMWEENEELHMSSVGACVAGLKSARSIPGIDVPQGPIESGDAALRKHLPRESPKKFVDLALLSLIWPYDVVTAEERDSILENVEYHLLRKHGVIRYKNDHYYNKNPDGYSEEAEWCFGMSWLAIIYERLGRKEKARLFIRKMLDTIDDEGQVPELYFSNSPEHNENSPLGWAESLFIVALYRLHEKTIAVK